ncbi:MAG TPA: NAD-glutamate dehydrogenase, partial [Alphaproteobacteria bacterium]|nr:NAD-glutamate dehydrogenase [Alphaproteobacteria bacterium]
DDMSFLVDSVVKALHQLDLPAYLVIHPVIQIKRIEGKRQKTGQGHAESFMQIRISEQTSPERILLIQERLL